MAYFGPYFQKPENVLKRAEDFIKINRKDQALDLLFELLSQRKYRTWQPAHEDVMRKFLELCVDSRNNRTAKEGLHQYRKLSENQAPTSLETVIEYMLALAEARCKKAAAECDSKESEDVEDLENDKTPESILLASVTSDKSKERTEREHLIPWLKFMWESYRSTLEILRHNPKMQNVYHRTAARTFAFCLDYKRNTEFRKLCDTLRAHVTKSRETEMSAESAEFHLATRFEALRVASVLRLWNEGFRTIEDIHAIFQKSDKRPSSQLEATYYRKLTELFLVSENFLFHAYAYKAYYMLSVEKNKSLTPEESRIMASCVLLSAMSIPLQNDKVGTTYAHRDSQKKKNRKMAHLLGFDINPKRKSILQDLLDQEILDVVQGDVREIYMLLECTFAPLDLVSRVVPLFDKLRASKKLANYISALEKLLIVRVVTQLAQVFYSVRLDTLESLLAPLKTPFLEIENTIIRAIKARQIDAHSVRIDHMAGCVRFGENFMEEQRTRLMLTDMARGLNTICVQLEPKGKAKLHAEQRAVRAKTVLKFLSATHEQVLRRKAIIEKRKEDFARVQAARKAENDRRKKDSERARKEQEKARIDKQRQAHERAQLEALEDEKRQFEMKQRLIEEGVDLKKANVVGMSAEEQQRLIDETRKKMVEESIESEKKIEATAKRLDTLVRALREREIPKLKGLFEARRKEDEAEHHKSWASHLERSKAEHEEAIKAKQEYSRMQASREDFEATLLKKWNAAYEEDRDQRWHECDQRLKHAKLERARKKRQSMQKELQRRKDEEARIERERQRQAEEEERRQAREEEEERMRAENQEREAALNAARSSGDDSRTRPSATPSAGAYRPRVAFTDEGDKMEDDMRAPPSRFSRDAPGPDRGADERPGFGGPRGASERPGAESFGGSSRGGGDRFGGSGDRFGGSGDRFGGSGDRFGGSGDRFGGSGERGFGGDRGGDRAFGGDRGGDRAFGGDRGGERAFGGDRGGERSFGGDRGGDRAFGGDRGGERGGFGGGRGGFGGDRGGFGGDRGGYGGDRGGRGGDRFAGAERGGRESSRGTFGRPGASDAERWRR